MRVRSTATSGVGTAANADAWSAYRTAEAETAAIERALDAGAESDAQVHIAHTSTPEGIDAVSDTDATCEVTPHHLFLSREDAGRLGTFGRMNPPLRRSEERRAAVFERLRDGDVDVVATDHAPHTVAEKRQRLVDAPSGVPGVETLYPLLLESVRKGNLSLERVRDVVAANPASIFEIEGKGRIEPGADADLVVVDLTNPARSRPALSTARPAGRPLRGYRASPGADDGPWQDRLRARSGHRRGVVRRDSRSKRARVVRSPWNRVPRCESGSRSWPHSACTAAALPTLFNTGIL